MVEIEEKGEITRPLLQDAASSSSSVSHPSLKRKGTLLTAVAHIITGVIGSGVLSLAWSVAQLGWIGGPLSMVVFGIITIVSSNLLCDCYRYPHPVVGHIRNRSYTEAVGSYLGKKSMWVTGIVLQESYFGNGVAYTITSAISMRAIMKSNCYHEQGHDAPCQYGDSLFMLLFGGVQVVFSQIPDFHNMELLSIVAAVMSFVYTFIGMALGLAKVVEDGVVKGSLGGTLTDSVAPKVWLSSQAIGDIAFAFTYNIILLDIQDTLKSPPPENKTMKKASTIAILITSFFFLCCGYNSYTHHQLLLPLLRMLRICCFWEPSTG